MRSIIKKYFVAIIFCVILLTMRGASAHAEHALVQTITPFLYPPYPGTASQESIFDHSTPNYTFDNRVLAFTGDVATRTVLRLRPQAHLRPGLEFVTRGVEDTGPTALAIGCFMMAMMVLIMASHIAPFMPRQTP